MWHDVDLYFLARQVILLSIASFFPIVIIAVWHPKRRLLVPLVSILTVSVGALVAWLTLIESTAIWTHEQLPYHPLRVGPSILGLYDLVRIMIVAGWAPVCAVAAWIWLRRDRTRWGLIALCGCAAWVAVLLLGTVWVCEYVHEDTVIAPGFSRSGWKHIRTGMTKPEVYRLIGQPLPRSLTPASGDELERWAFSWSAGYFAAVVFDNERVTRKEFSFSD